MKRFIISSILSAVLFSALFSIVGCMPHTTGETEVGVRTRKIGLFAPKGVEDRVYAQGATYFFIPFINDWHVFDTKLQNLEMTFSKIRGDRRSQDDLLFKTIDGNDISLDVIIAFRIDAKKAPYILQYVARNDATCVKPLSEPLPEANPGIYSASLKPKLFMLPSQERPRPTRPKMHWIRSWVPWGS